MTTVDLDITASKDEVGQPLIWRLSREFNVQVTILKANVDVDFGWMSVQLQGPVEEIQRATAWLLTTGLRVEARQRSLAE